MSREIDARIAETIFGWEWWRSSKTGKRCLFAPGYIPRGSFEWFHERADGTEPLVGDWAHINIPAYSTEIATAYLVIEKLKPEFTCNTTTNSHQYAASFLMQLENDEFIYVTIWDEKSLPYAICTAALQALDKYKQWNDSHYQDALKDRHAHKQEKLTK